MKLSSGLAGKLLFCGVSIASAALMAESVRVAAGETRTVSASATAESLEVHGALNVAGAGPSAGTVLTLSPAESVVPVGSASGDDAVVSVGDYGRIVGGQLVLGGAGGRGSVVVGGRRINNRTAETWDGQDAHWSCRQVVMAADATSPSGVLDILTLNPGGAFGLVQGMGQRIINRSSTADARILFKGGRFCVYNAFSSGYLFSTAANNINPNDIPQGKGGRAIVLESVDGNPIDLYHTFGTWQWPCVGTMRTAGAGDVVLTCLYHASYQSGWFLDNCIKWGHGGDLKLAGTFRLQLRSSNNLPGAAQNGGIVLAGDSLCHLDFRGTSQQINGLVANAQSYVTNSLATTANVTIGHNGNDCVWSVPRLGVNGGSIALRKEGAGTLTVRDTPVVDVLNVAAGDAVFTGCDTAVGTLIVGLGRTVTVKGCTLRVKSLTNGGRILCEDGGRVVLDTARDTYLAYADMGGGFVKDGPGTTTLHGSAPISDDVHVAAGTLAFARIGTTNHWLRFSFTKMNWGTFNLSEMLIMNAAGARIDGGGSVKSRVYERNGSWSDGSAVVNAGATVAPKDMPPCSIWAGDQNWNLAEPDGGYRERSPSALFDGVSWSKLQYPTQPSATNPKVFVVRLPAAATDVYQYNFRNGYSGTGHPTAWTVETSPDGVSWQLVDDKSGIVPPSGTQQFYNGGTHFRLLTGQSGAPGLAPGAKVRVDAGATLDGSGVADGQEVSDLAVDCAAGGGTLKGVRLAGTGTLRLTGVSGKLKGGETVPLTFADATAPKSFGGWTVLVDGVPQPVLLGWRDGRIVVLPTGTALVFR